MGADSEYETKLAGRASYAGFSDPIVDKTATGIQRKTRSYLFPIIADNFSNFALADCCKSFMTRELFKIEKLVRQRNRGMFFGHCGIARPSRC